MIDTVMYDETGTILKAYDATLHHHVGVLTAAITTEQAAEIDKYRVNPNNVTVYAIPTCAEQYIKKINNVWEEMTTEEKTVVDNNLAAEAAQRAAPVHYKSMIRRQAGRLERQGKAIEAMVLLKRINE